MHLWKSLSATLVLAIALVACGSDDSNGAKSGNAQACGEGQTCNNNCDSEADKTSCQVSCPKNAKCTAKCNAGQSCQFACDPSAASCAFDCTLGTCTVAGGAQCSCKGTCTPNQCGGGTGTGGSGAGGAGVGGAGIGGTGQGGMGYGGMAAGGSGVGGSAGGGTCEDACGAPTDPGYAECIAACAQQ